MGNDDYFKTWVLSKILANLNEGKMVIPNDFFIEVYELIDFGKMNKNHTFFALLILDTLKHELLEDYKDEVSEFAEKLFVELINIID